MVLVIADQRARLAVHAASPNFHQLPRRHVRHVTPRMVITLRICFVVLVCAAIGFGSALAFRDPEHPKVCVLRDPRAVSLAQDYGYTPGQNTSTSFMP